MNLADLKRKGMADLSAVADQLAVDGAGSMARQDLLVAILQAQGRQGGDITAEGVLECLADGFGFLRSPDYSYMPGADDIYVSPSQIRRFDLRTGDTVLGKIRPPKDSERFFALLKVEAVNGEPPDGRRGQATFDELTPLHPDQKFRLEHTAGELSTRILDLLCPLGKGQRCLIVSPPRAGKTSLLRDIARSIEVNHPEAHLLVLLIDERPEEVTEMQRTVGGQVISSTFDEQAARHVQVAEIVIEKARRLAERGQDVVLLLDSITRLARAYDAAGGKVGAGGIDPAALHRTKRFFGSARNLEGGGSLTILATALIDTGSAIDQVIFEELEGTGNAGIYLDRTLLEQRIFPCLDLRRTGTRKEELLLAPAALAGVLALRQLLHPLSVAEAMELVRARLSTTERNDELIAGMGS